MYFFFSMRLLKNCVAVFLVSLLVYLLYFGTFCKQNVQQNVSKMHSHDRRELLPKFYLNTVFSTRNA